MNDISPGNEEHEHYFAAQENQAPPIGPPIDFLSQLLLADREQQQQQLLAEELHLKHVQIELENQDPPIDLDMFEVQLLETEHNSSNGTGSGSGVGSHRISPIDISEPTMAASTSTASDLDETPRGRVAGLISDWCDVGTARSHLAVVMLAVLAVLADPNETWADLVRGRETSSTMYTWSDKHEARGVDATTDTIQASSWIDLLLSGTTDHLHIFGSGLALLGAAWCWHLPIWAKDWLGRVELERNTTKAVRRTCMRFFLYIPMPLVQIVKARSYQGSGSVQTSSSQLLGLSGIIFLFVIPILLQADGNASGMPRGCIRRAGLLAHGVLSKLLTVGTGVQTFTLEEAWSDIARWYFCSALIYTSLIDHLQDSLFILALCLAASPAGLMWTVGLTLTSMAALCGKLMWCRLHLENGRSIEEER